MRLIKIILVAYIILVAIFTYKFKDDTKKIDASYTPSEEEIAEYQLKLREEDANITEKQLEMRTNSYIAQKHNYRETIKIGFWGALKKAMLIWGAIFGITILLIIGRWNENMQRYERANRYGTIRGFWDRLWFH